MAYCTITDIQGLNPKRTYSATSTPTLTQIGVMITRIAAEIDTILQGRGLATPVTSPADLLTYLTQINAYGASALAEQAMFPEASGIGQTSHGSQLWKQYQEALDQLRKGVLPETVSGVGPGSFLADYGAGDAEETDDSDWAQPKFGINKEF